MHEPRALMHDIAGRDEMADHLAAGRGRNTEITIQEVVAEPSSLVFGIARLMWENVLTSASRFMTAPAFVGAIAIITRRPNFWQRRIVASRPKR
jgi:hypothetical protein